MPTTISISLASISGEAGPFTLFLRKTSDRAIVNTGGDALTEVEVATVKTGVWTATVAETIPAEDCHARIYEGASEAAAAILIDSILYESETEIGKEPSSGGGSGTGARTVTITVNDGTTALQNAIVRMTEGVNTYTATTNVSGVCTFNLDDATYTVSITKSGYSYAGTTLVVDGTEAVTYSMTQITPSAPDDPALCAVTFHLRDQYGADRAAEPVEITFVKWETGAAETPPVVSVPPVQTTDAGGRVEVDLYRDATYRIVYGSAGYAKRIDVIVPDAGSYTVEI
jgi:hypothetical protein